MIQNSDKCSQQSVKNKQQQKQTNRRTLTFGHCLFDDLRVRRECIEGFQHHLPAWRTQRSISVCEDALQGWGEEERQRVWQSVVSSYWKEVSAAAPEGWTTLEIQRCCSHTLDLMSLYSQPAEDTNMITIQGFTVSTCKDPRPVDLYLQNQLLHSTSSMNPQQGEEQLEVTDALRLWSCNYTKRNT